MNDAKARQGPRDFNQISCRNRTTPGGQDRSA
jgi:hypothetical protein